MRQRLFRSVVQLKQFSFIRLLSAFVFVLSFFFLFTPAKRAHAAGSVDYLEFQSRLQEVFRENHDAVVKVMAFLKVGGVDGRSLIRIGTGFFISRDGLVMTSSNITSGADRISIEYRGVPYVARVLGEDTVSNVSILRAESCPDNLTFLRLGDSPSLPQRCTFLMAITCQFGMDPSPSLGIATGKNTNYGDRFLPAVYLRTDIPSDGGESGSPVFEMNGQLVGMMVASLPEIRSSLVLPSRAAMRVRDDILDCGAMRYGWFGLVTREVANKSRGIHILIEEVAPGSPAAKAGIKGGDILTRIGEQAVFDDETLRSATFFARPGQMIGVTILRENKELEFALKVEERPVTPSPPGGIGHGKETKTGITGTHQPVASPSPELSVSRPLPAS